MSGRLALFENLFLSVMVGLILGFLVAARFMPWLVAPVFPDTTQPAPVTNAATTANFDIKQQDTLLGSRNGRADPRNAPKAPPSDYVQVPTPRHRHAPYVVGAPARGRLGQDAHSLMPQEADDTRVIFVPYAGGLHTAFFLCLVLFIIKYLHENSVLTFWCNRDPHLAGATFPSCYEALSFALRILFLGSLYMLVISVYGYSAGWFMSHSYLASFVFFGYMAPDFFLLQQLRRRYHHGDLDPYWPDLRVLLVRRETNLFEAIQRWWALDMASFLLIVLLFSDIYFEGWYRVLDRYVQAHVAGIVIGVAGALLFFCLLLWCGWLNLPTWVVPYAWQGLVWFLILAGAVIAIRLGVHLRFLDESELGVLIAVCLLVINLSDWAFNRQLFFGKLAPMRAAPTGTVETT